MASVYAPDPLVVLLMPRATIGEWIVILVLIASGAGIALFIVYALYWLLIRVLRGALSGIAKTPNAAVTVLGLICIAAGGAAGWAGL